MPQTPKHARKRSLLAVVTAVTIAFAAMLGSVAMAPAASAAISTTESTFVSKLNGARSARGVHRLAVRSDLVAVARAQAARMATRASLYHNPNLTRDVRNWRWVGENVGYGPDAPTIHRAFMNSPAHKANIVDRDYTEIGVGVVIRNGRVWVAEVFRKPRVSATSAGMTTAYSTTAWKNLRLGSRGTMVKRVQQRLGLRQTGYYGHATKRAVGRFQVTQGWRAYGVVGLRTKRALNI